MGRKRNRSARGKDDRGNGRAARAVAGLLSAASASASRSTHCTTTSIRRTFFHLERASTGEVQHDSKHLCYYCSGQRGWQRDGKLREKGVDRDGIERKWREMLVDNNWLLAE
ncbi:hypothetical protein WR25_22731 [Diploscapter pachys]|uniref:Uncharacterized protein n=1 Tax=Diploscapter pachys TaxID=2018661 RepID=A0A2A2KV30_9BILA|nr:hypothetical protein WR25_22731 [Diploscapter pachys]